jgi:hypothetical protein
MPLQARTGSYRFNIHLTLLLQLTPKETHLAIQVRKQLSYLKLYVLMVYMIFSANRYWVSCTSWKRKYFALIELRPAAFLDDLATNATRHGVKILIYSGNDDDTVPHLGSESEPVFPPWRTCLWHENLVTIQVLCELIASKEPFLTFLDKNTTFGGIQGFTRKPSTPWYDDSGHFAGIIHQERNWTYILVADAGHQVPEFQPQFVRK